MKRLDRTRFDQITTADVIGRLRPALAHQERDPATLAAEDRRRHELGCRAGLPRRQPRGRRDLRGVAEHGNHAETATCCPFAEVGAALDKAKASGAYKGTVLVIEFLVLTVCRSSEVRLAEWDDVHLESGTWTIPANRMKAKRDHPVPRSARALENLPEVRSLSGGMRRGVPVGARPGAQRQLYLQAPPGPRDRGRAARLPLFGAGLGSRVLRCATRGPRVCPRSLRRRKNTLPDIV